MNPEQIRARIRELLEQRATHEQTVTQVRAAVGDQTPNAEQTSTLRAARDAIVGLDAELDQAQAALREVLDEQTRNAAAAALRTELGQTGENRGQGGAVVGREERTYTPDKDRRGEASFFSDAFRSHMLGDVNALSRLQRHAQEID